jgi:YfiH family protein
MSPAVAHLPCATVIDWRIPGLVHGFFGRAGGVSQGAFASLNVSSMVGDDTHAVSENWRRVRFALGENLQIARMRQVHGNRVAVAGSRALQVGEADAMVSDAPGVALAVLTADCVPLLFVAPERRAVAVAHAGWRGTAAQVVPATVARLQKLYGVRPEDLRVALGPAIAGCCYEVDASVAAQFRAIDAAAVTANGADKAKVDLRAINVALLQRAGVRAASITVVGPCTQCAAHDYFSHRAHAGRTGRQLSVIGWSEQ